MVVYFLGRVGRRVTSILAHENSWTKGCFTLGYLQFFLEGVSSKRGIFFVLVLEDDDDDNHGEVVEVEGFLEHLEEGDKANAPWIICHFIYVFINLTVLI